MESEKSGQSDGSSEEIDHHQVDKEQIRETTVEQASGKRLYECVFCKRGFTNAQALGGHMNIHRKDRAKSSSSSFPSKQPPNPSYTAAAAAARVARPFSFDPFEKSDSSDPWEAMRIKLPHNIVCPDNSYGRESDYLRTVHSGRNDHLDENLGSNLSLQIGSSHGENIDVAKDGEERDEIDLELRLGRDP